MIDHLSGRISGLLLGTAVGDALGLPYEGLSRGRAGKLLPGPLRHRFLLGHGMISDDTEHAFMAAQTILEESCKADVFARKFARRLRWWFVSLPAGVGMATAKECIKLLFGFSPKRSGVFSAGNGPAMRAAVFGAVFCDEKKRNEFLEAAPRITHTDLKALTGAIAVAGIAAFAIHRTTTSRPNVDEISAILRNVSPDDETWNKLVDSMFESWNAEDSVPGFADKLGLQKGVSGYVYHTVPVAIYAWLRHYGDFRRTLETIIECGGDTDTVAAIGGALAGATVGESGIPQEWIDGIRDVPINANLLRETGRRLAELYETKNSPAAVKYAWFLSVPRNLFFLAVVLCHGFRRLGPPY